MPDQHHPEHDSAPPRRALDEDWLAVIAGLTLIALVLLGAIPGSLIP